MLVAFLLGGLLQISPPPIRAADIFANPRVPKDIYHAVARASGADFCPGTLKKKQNRRFDRRYGMRFNKVVAIVAARDGLGWGPDGPIVITGCIAPTPRHADRMFEAFEAELRALERRYGLIRQPKAADCHPSQG